MNNRILVFCLLFLFSLFSKTYADDKIVVSEDVYLIHLDDSIFIHVSYVDSEDFGRYPSNGLLVIKNSKALMVDTPVTCDLTQTIYNFLSDSLGVRVEKVIPCHYHNDCLGGLEFLHQKGVESFANNQTINLCRSKSLPVPQFGFIDSLKIDFYGKNIECRYFGGGHTADNIVVWLNDNKILFGGCLVKSIHSTGLGNIADAVVDDWDVTLKKVVGAYPRAKIVIPGHGGYGGTELLNHTIDLVNTYNAKR